MRRISISSRPWPLLALRYNFSRDCWEMYSFLYGSHRTEPVWLFVTEEEASHFIRKCGKLPVSFVFATN